MSHEAMRAAREALVACLCCTAHGCHGACGAGQERDDAIAALDAALSAPAAPAEEELCHWGYRRNEQCEVICCEMHGGRRPGGSSAAPADWRERGLRAVQMAHARGRLAERRGDLAQFAIRAEVEATEREAAAILDAPTRNEGENDE